MGDSFIKKPLQTVNTRPILIYSHLENWTPGLTGSLHGHVTFNELFTFPKPLASKQQNMDGNRHITYLLKL